MNAVLQMASADPCEPETQAPTRGVSIDFHRLPDGRRIRVAHATHQLPATVVPFVDQRDSPQTIEASADARLDKWGAWARDHGMNVGYPRATLLAKMIDQQCRGAAQSQPPVSMPDEIAEVDRAVAALSQLMRGVILAHYLTYAPSEVKARALHLSRAHFWRLLKRAQRKVYFALEMRR